MKRIGVIFTGKSKGVVRLLVANQNPCDVLNRVSFTNNRFIASFITGVSRLFSVGDWKTAPKLEPVTREFWKGTKPTFGNHIAFEKDQLTEYDRRISL